MWIFILVFCIINMALAKYDAKKILSNKRIDHTFNAILYLGLCTLALIPFYYHHPLEGLWIFANLLLIRKVVFDVALNLFRGLKWNYLSHTTSSKIDKIENWVFDYKGTFKYIFYTVMLTALIIYYFK